MPLQIAEVLLYYVLLSMHKPIMAFSVAGRFGGLSDRLDDEESASDGSGLGLLFPPPEVSHSHYFWV